MCNVTQFLKLRPCQIELINDRMQKSIMANSNEKTSAATEKQTIRSRTTCDRFRTCARRTADSRRPLHPQASPFPDDRKMSLILTHILSMCPIPPIVLSSNVYQFHFFSRLKILIERGFTSYQLICKMH